MSESTARFEALESRVQEVRDSHIEIVTSLKAIKWFAGIILTVMMSTAGGGIYAVITNGNRIEELSRDGHSHATQGHPELRREVVEVRTEVRGLTASVDTLSENVERYRQSNEDLLDRRSGAGNRDHRSGRSGSSR